MILLSVEAQEICISGMIMMMLLTTTMKRWPEANLSPDLGRTEAGEWKPEAADAMLLAPK